MNFLDKATLSFMGASTLALMVMAVAVPIDRTAYTPHAEFLPPDAVPEVVSAEELQLNSVKNGRPLYTVGALLKAFSRINYDFHAVRNGKRPVPRLFVNSLPKDMRAIRVVERRKELFFKSVLPLVLQVNDEIRSDRARLVSLRTARANRIKTSAADRLWLAAMADRYKVDRDELTEMIRRVDIIPPSLGLAQAAEESGWGTSRFVIEGNALFGQWTVDNDQGLVPADRDANKTHKIKAFDSLLDGVRAYARNLNTHRAYRHFRSSRAQLRHGGSVLDGLSLSADLTSYSERGEKYVESIQNLIRANRLEKLDRAKLSDEVVHLNRKVPNAGSET